MLKKLLAACLINSTAYATTFTTDISDLWYAASESGWGVNLIHQSDTLFATMFVYSSSGVPIWYVASGATYTGQQGTALVFSGPLYQTNGPWFGGPFDPNAVGIRQVGNITFSFSEISAGTVSYSVDGVTVTKSVTRQTWKANRLFGTYLGATIGTYSGCLSGNGYSEVAGSLSIVHNPQFGPAFSMTFNDGRNPCTYSGTYTQAGRMGSVSGSLSCLLGDRGSFEAFEIEGSITAVTARAIVNLGGSCRWEGRIGGLRKGA